MGRRRRRAAAMLLFVPGCCPPPRLCPSDADCGEAAAAMNKEKCAYFVSSRGCSRQVTCCDASGTYADLSEAICAMEAAVLNAVVALNTLWVVLALMHQVDGHVPMCRTSDARVLLDDCKHVVAYGAAMGACADATSECEKGGDSCEHVVVYGAAMSTCERGNIGTTCDAAPAASVTAPELLPPPLGQGRGEGSARFSEEEVLSCAAVACVHGSSEVSCSQRLARPAHRTWFDMSYDDDELDEYESAFFGARVDGDVPDGEVVEPPVKIAASAGEDIEVAADKDMVVHFESAAGAIEPLEPEHLVVPFADEIEEVAACAGEDVEAAAAALSSLVSGLEESSVTDDAGYIADDGAEGTACVPFLPPTPVSTAKITGVQVAAVMDVAMQVENTACANEPLEPDERSVAAASAEIEEAAAGIGEDVEAVAASARLEQRQGSVDVEEQLRTTAVHVRI